MSYDFDGSGSANLNAATPITALPFTIACWYKVEADGAGHALISIGNATDSEMMRLSAQTDVTGDPVRIRATNSGGTTADTSTSTSVTQNTWEHACAVISSTTVRSVYRNGGGKASSSSNSRNITAATRLAIGAAYQAGTYGADTEGKIAHVAVWDIALSDAEVALLAGGDNPLTVQAANLVAYWPLTADLVDVVGAVTLTNGGGVTFDGADNPTVDAPPGSSIEGALSASIGTITLSATGVGPGSASEGALNAAIGDITLAATGSGYQIPTISRPAGGGDVSVASTIITDGYTATPTIELFGDPETNDNISGTKWEGLYADVDLKQAGRTPVFKLDFSDWRVSTPPSNNKLYWRYASDIGDLYAWQPFDNRSVASSILTVSNNSAFTETAIQIANIPPVPYEELEDWLTTWDANGNIYRPQACADLAVSSSAPNKYAYFDFPDQLSPDGIQVGTSYAFAFGVTNPAVTSPKKRLFHTWTHAGEWGGLRAMMRFAERIMSVSDADHDVLRDEFDHVFMFCNTAGMVGGMARGSAEPGDVGEDTNRVWGSNAIDRSDVTDTQNAIEASVDLLVTEWGVNGSDLLNCTGQIAWHSHTASATKFGTYSDGFSTTETAFLGYLEAIYGAALHNYGASSTGSSTAFSRTGTVGGFGVTFEWSYAFADFLNEIGTSVDTIGPALVDTFQAGYFGRTAQVDASIGNITLAAVGALPVAGTLSTPIGTIVLSSAGRVAIAGAVSANIGAISLSATGELALATGSGTLSQSIGEISLSAAGALSLAGAVSASIGTIALASTSKVAIAGALTASVGAVTLSAAGVSTTSTNGALAATLGPVTLSSAARLAIAGSVNTSIGLITLSATNVAGITSPTPPERRAAAIGESRRAAA